MNEKISIIVPVYNVEKYLSRCIDSIISQTYSNIEVILVDDGSQDDSGKICDEYLLKDSRIRVIHKENGGLSSARNVGMELSTGKYIGFVDSDDWIALDMYAHMYQLLVESKSDVASIQSIVVRNSNEWEINSRPLKIECFQGQSILEDYLKSERYSVCSRLYKKELFREKIKFPNGKIYEDIATNYKILLNAKKIVKSNQVKYFYFYNFDSISKSKFKKKDFDLLDACDELSILTHNEKYGNIKQLAQLKKGRSYFSLLAKMAYFGIDNTSVGIEEIIRYLQKNLRINFLLLIKSKISLSRKVMICLFCINFNFVAFCVDFYKKVNNLCKNY